MIVRRATDHIGDALMALAMMQQIHEETGETFVWQGTSATNALMLGIDYIQTVGFEQVTNWDLDLTCLSYAGWHEYAKAFSIKWNGKPASLKLSDDEVKLTGLPDTGKLRIGLCTVSRDKHRSYPHHEALVKLLKKQYDAHVFGRERLPVRQLVSEVSQMDWMCSVDTGLAHMAGCLGVPLTIIEGPTDCKVVYYPYKDVRCVFTGRDGCKRKPCVNNPCKHASCMYLVEPERIVKTIEKQPEQKVIPIIDVIVQNETSHSDNNRNGDKILVLRMKGVGDVLMTWFGLEVLRQENPDAYITYVTSKSCAELFYGQNDLVDKVMPISWEYEPHGVPELPYYIQNVPHDRLIDLTNRIDFHDTIEETLGSRELLHISPRADNFATCMDVSLNGNVHHRTLKIHDEMNKWAEQLLNEWASNSPHPPIISCQLDAKGATRNWHIDRWIQLSKLLVEEGYGVIWFSVTSGHQSLKLDGVLNLSCQTSLSQMVALMSKCRYAISTCSASVHIAHRLPETTPIGIYGSTDYKLLGTYYDDLIPITNYSMGCAPCVDWGYECLNQPGGPWCINQINPKRIYETIQKQECGDA